MSSYKYKKIFSYSLLLILLLLLLQGCWLRKKDTLPEGKRYSLTIYAHSELEELLNKLLPLFEERNRCDVEVRYAKTAGDLVSMLLEDKDDPQADIVIGINNGNYAWVLENDLVQPYKPKEADIINNELKFEPNFHFIPFAYAYYAIMYDTYLVKKPPETFGKMQDGIWKNHLLISDARYSANGLGFLLWSVSMYGERGYGHFWRSIKNNILHVSPNWEQAYNMFLAGEAPFLLAYTTTPAFYIETENNYRYRTFIPNEGAYMFVESVGIVKEAKNLTPAMDFIDYVISREFQNQIAPTIWMYPVNERAITPASYRDIPIPQNVLNKNIKNDLKVSRITGWINFWSSIMID